MCGTWSRKGEQRSAGRWPLMLCTGGVVVRRITWVSPSVGLVTLPGKLPATYTRDPGGRMAKFLLVKFSVMAEITDADALREAALEKFDANDSTSDDYPDTADWHVSEEGQEERRQVATQDVDALSQFVGFGLAEARRLLEVIDGVPGVK